MRARLVSLVLFSLVLFSVVPVVAFAQSATPTPALKNADPPLLGKWYAAGGAAPIRGGIVVAAEPRDIETPLGDTKATSDLAVLFGGGGSVTSWLELGGQIYEVFGNYDIRGNPTFDSVGTVTIGAAPLVRPYLRLGRGRIWAMGGYAVGFTEVTVNYAELPITESAHPSKSQTWHGPVYGGGIDIGFGKKNALVLTAWYEAGAPEFDVKVKDAGRVRGTVMPDSRIVVGLGWAI